MKTRSLLAVLAVLLVVPAAAGYEDLEAQQASLIYVTVGGRSHSVMLMHPALSARDAGKLDVRMKFHPDLPLWIGGEKVEPGERTWRLVEEGPHQWTLGPAAEDGTRHKLDVRKAAVERAWLTTTLTPHPSGNAVVLTFAVGAREGTLILSLEESAKFDSGDKVDVQQMVMERDRLLTAAATIEEARRSRHLWSVLLSAVGDQVVATGEQCWIDGFDFSRDDDLVRFGVRGHLHKDLGKPEDFGAKMQSGPVAKAFPKFLKPQWSAADDAGLRGFVVVAQTPAADWRKITPLPARTTGRDPAKLGCEILLLESRIAHLAPATVTDLTQGRSLLLEAKREAMALISGLKPGTPAESPDGLGTFEIALKVTGASTGIVEFLRVLEDRKEPLRVVPQSLKGTKFGPELTLKIVFLSYRPLSVRQPRVDAMARSRGRGPDFDEVKAAYLKDVGSPGDRPFASPAWKRDPFAAPAEEE